MPRKSNEKSRRPRICLPRYPAKYTSTVKPDGNNSLTLAPSGFPSVSYALKGWVEHSFEPPREGDPPHTVRLSLLNVNLTGTQRNELCTNAPNSVHISLATGTTPCGTLDLITGRACLTVPIELEYTELERDRHHVRKPAKGHLPSIIPLQSTLSVAISYDIKAGGFTTAATGNLRELPPFTNTSVPVAFLLACPCDSKSYCLEVCLSIKVATQINGTPILTTQEVEDLVKRINDIWDCDPPAQCCIRFTIDEILAPMKPAIPRSVIYKAPGFKDFYRVLKMNRSSKCYNVYFVSRMTGALGATGFGSDSGSIIRTQGRTQADSASTFSHEMGHAMGLAQGSTDEPDGVTGHSTKGDNVMGTLTGAARIKLNKKQCDKARSSSLAKKTDKECTPNPNET